MELGHGALFKDNGHYSREYHLAGDAKGGVWMDTSRVWDLEAEAPKGLPWVTLPPGGRDGSLS